MLNALIDKLQAALPPNRVVVIATPVLTPLIASVAAWLAPWAAEHLPGLPQFTAGQLTAFGVTGAAAAIVAAVKLADRYIDGWQLDEARKHSAKQAEIERVHAETLTALEADNPSHALEALRELRESTALPPEPPSVGDAPIPAPPPGPPDPPRPPQHRPVGDE